MRLLQEVVSAVDVSDYNNLMEQVLEFYTPIIISENKELLKNSDLILESNNLTDIHNNIKNFIIDDFSIFLETVSEIISNDVLTIEDKIDILFEATAFRSPSDAKLNAMFGGPPTRVVTRPVTNTTATATSPNPLALPVTTPMPVRPNPLALPEPTTVTTPNTTAVITPTPVEPAPQTAPLNKINRDNSILRAMQRNKGIIGSVTRGVTTNAKMLNRKGLLGTAGYYANRISNRFQNTLAKRRMEKDSTKAFNILGKDAAGEIAQNNGPYNLSKKYLDRSTSAYRLAQNANAPIRSGIITSQAKEYYRR
jgi:hypothetical protein